MEKTFKRLLSWLVVLALVLPMVPAFTLPASAAKTDTKAQVVYGSTNLDAIADANEKALVQARIALLEQMIADPAAALQQLENYCPVCNQVVTWEDWTGAVAISGGNQKHLRVLSDRTIDASWPLEFYGDAASAHVLLAGNVQLKGPILCNTGCTNTDITIFGTGSITSGRLFRPLGNAKLTLIGGTYIPTSATYPSIDGGSLTAGSQINIYPHTVIGPANKDLVITNITAQQATINMYGGEIRNGQQTAAELGGNIGLKTSATLNMYGGTVSNGSNTAAKGGNIASYSSSATINIYGGTVSGGSGAIGANLYGFGHINIGGTALITGATATGDGGNIYQTGGKTLSISGGKIEGGSAAYGGNVYIAGTAKLNMTGGTISAGTATTAGGNLYADAGTTITIKDATITAGSAKNGGNISTSAAFTIENTTISNGTATGFGGNIYRAGGALATITGSEIKGGKAAYGANVHLHEDGSGVGSAMVMNNTTVGATRESEGVFNIGVYWGSKLAMIGGSINSEGVAARLAGDTNDPSQMVLAGTAAVSGNIFVDGKSTLAVDTGWTGSAEVTPAKTFAVGAPLMNSDTLPAAIVGTLNADNTFTAGGALAGRLTSGEYDVVTADAATGALMLQEHVISWVKINDSVHMNALTGAVEEHAAGCAKCEALPADFCPVCNETVTWTEVAGGNTNNSVSSGNLHLKVTGTKTTTKGWPVDVMGHNSKVHIYLDNADWTLDNTNGTILFNSGNTGHNLTIFGNGTIKNTSTVYGIVAVQGAGHTINLIGGTYTAAAKQSVARREGRITGTGTKINVYPSAVLSTGIHAEQMEVNVYGGQINAYTGARAILLENGSVLNMMGGTVSGGSFAGDGGNIYITGGSTVNMSGGTVTGGNANYGGNIYVVGGSKLNVTGGTISNGTASVRGGNIFTDASATVSIKNATITGGEAPNGGSISSSAAITIENSTISGGNATKATGMGGNLYLNGAGKVVQITNSTISGGKHTYVGSNAYISGATVIATNTNFTADEGSDYGSVGVYDGATLAMVGGKVESAGTAVRLASSKLALMGNAVVSSETEGVYVDGSSTLAADKTWTGSATVYFAKKNNFTVGEPLMNSETTPAAIVGTVDASYNFTPGGALAGTLNVTYGHKNPIVTLDETSGTLTLQAVDCVPEVVPGKAPTCTETGLTEGSKCSVCGKTLVAQEEIPVADHTASAPVQENVVGATCEAAGSYEEVVYCSVCNAEMSREAKTTEKLAHTVVLVSAEVPAGCYTFGKAAVYQCSECGTYFKDAEGTEVKENGETPDLIQPNGHELTFVAGTAATCEDAGTKDHYKCSVCGGVYENEDDYFATEQYDIVIAATGHTEETVPGYAADCENTGLTDGVKCSVCGEILTAQEEIAATGHTAETVPGYAADCENIGKTDGVKCSVCGKILTAQEDIAALGHTEETIPGYAATCENTGLTDGVKCSVCGKTLVAQEEIAALGHTEETVPGYAADCENTGLTDGVKCSVCGKTLVAQEEIAATGHTEETVPGYAADCENTGLTDGVKCSVCGKILTAQEEIAALGHAYGEWTPVDANEHKRVCANDAAHIETAPHGEAVEGKCPDCGYVIDPSYGAIAKVTFAGTTVYCKTLDELLAGVGTIPAGVAVEVQLLADIVLPATLEIPNGMDLTLDLNGKTLSGTDTTNTSYALIKNAGKLTVKDSAEGGKITLTATQDTGYNRYSTVISNTVGGELIVESGTIQHLGGHTMAYAIDNLTNGTGTSAVTTINGGLINSSYVGIRQFLNGTEATNELTVNGGTVTGGNCSIFFQSPSAKANSGKLVIGENAKIEKRIYFGGEDNSPKLDIEVSIAEAALADGVEIVLDSGMAGYAVENENGIIGVNFIPELPTATVEKIENDELTFAMNFAAVAPTAEQLDYYGGWYADYVLTVNKPMTLNANGTADGWLSGQYDEFDENWYNVPPEDVVLAAGDSIMIMKYASELLKEPGLRYTYKEACEVVKNFDCGMFLTREYLMANPDLEVTLELRLFKDKEDTVGTKIGETYVFTIPELPEANANEVENDDLTFAMNYEAVTPTDEQLDFYGSWYADYVLTVNKPVTFNANGTADGWLSGQYDDFGPNWYNVPPEDVSLGAGESIMIMKYASELLKEPGLRFTYEQIVEIVDTFNCGVFLDEEFQKNNLDLEITLELRLFQNAEDEVGTKIGETYVFAVADNFVARNTVTGEVYGDVELAVYEAKSGETVELLQDCAAEELWIRSGRTLDLNGYKLTVSGEVTAASGTAQIKDSSAGKGVLAVAAQDAVAFNTANAYLPIWVEGEGFHFVIHTFETRIRTSTNGNSVRFRFWMDGAADCYAAQQLADGGADNGVSVKVKMTWTNSKGQLCEQFFTFPDSQLAEYATNADAENNWGTNVLYVTVSGIQDVTGLTFTAMITYGDSVQLASAAHAM